MFGPKTLEEIQSTFTKAVEDPKLLRSDNAKEVDRNSAEIERRLMLNEGLERESMKAARFQDNLEKLLA